MTSRSIVAVAALLLAACGQQASEEPQQATAACPEPNDQGIVENVERFGIQDGQIVALSRRVTDSNTTGVSFIQQLFGSLGNFNPATLLNDG